MKFSTNSTRPLGERFFERVKKVGECWMWAGSGTMRKGVMHGHLHMNGRLTMANRVSWVLHHGEIPPGMMVSRTCLTPGCVNPEHLRLATKKNNPRWVEPKFIRQRMIRFVDEDGPVTDERLGKCHVWRGNTDKYGYGHTGVRGKNTLAHRAWYEVHKGKIPAGLQLDHLCFNPPCVNPDHLEPVTHKENMRRSKRAMKPNCVRGHPLSGDNLRMEARSKDGEKRFRRCVACTELRSAARRTKKASP